MLKLQRTPTKSSFGFEEFEDDSCGFWFEHQVRNVSFGESQILLFNGAWKSNFQMSDCSQVPLHTA